MSRANYVKRLEHDLEASKKIIDELIREIYELNQKIKCLNRPIYISNNT